MQLRKLAAFFVYLGSYLPLSLILLAQDIDQNAIRRGFCRPVDIICDCSIPLMHPYLAIGAVMVCALCLSLTFAILQFLRPKNRVEIVESKHIPADLINYVIPYVLSFISVDYSSPQSALGFAVFFSWMFWLTFKTGQIPLNPVLAGFRWKLYEVKYRFLDGTDIFVSRALSKLTIEPEQQYRHASLQDVMILESRFSEDG